MILEGIVTTLNADQSTNIAAMGPDVDREITRLCLRPYRSSTTYQNLKRHGEGVFHVTDDVELVAHCALGLLEPPPRLVPTRVVRGNIVADVCRWYAFRVLRLDDDQARASIDCQIVEQGRFRDFFGFNLLPGDEIQGQMEQLSILVEKTAGDQERRAFEFLRHYVQNEIQTMGELRPARQG
jgi:hypothetical protein